jgi:hypothetical protein
MVHFSYHGSIELKQPSLKIGAAAPDFLPDAHDEAVHLHSLLARRAVFSIAAAGELNPDQQLAAFDCHPLRSMRHLDVF